MISKGWRLTSALIETHMCARESHYSVNSFLCFGFNYNVKYFDKLPVELPRWLIVATNIVISY